MMEPCKKCEIFNESALINGYDFGICEECFKKSYVQVYLPYEPQEKKDIDFLNISE